MAQKICSAQKNFSTQKFSIALVSVQACFDDTKDILEEVYDDGDDIFEKVSDDVKDILEEVYDDGDDIFLKKFWMMLKTYLRNFPMMVMAYSKKF